MPVPFQSLFSRPIRGKLPYPQVGYPQTIRKISENFPPQNTLFNVRHILLLVAAAATLAFPALAQEELPAEKPLKGVKAVTVLVKLLFDGKDNTADWYLFLPSETEVKADTVRRLDRVGLRVFEPTLGKIQGVLTVTVQTARNADHIIFAARVALQTLAPVLGNSITVTIWDRLGFGSVSPLKSIETVDDAIKSLVTDFQAEWRAQNQ